MTVLLGSVWLNSPKRDKQFIFNGQAFKGNGHGLCFDIETKETYWITGVKKDGQNRHWAGKGKIMIDKLIVDDFLKRKGWPCLDLSKFELVDVKRTDKQRFVAFENGSLQTVSVLDKYPDLKSLSLEELKKAVEYLRRRERGTNPNKL
jgi:hypothetical protein